MLVCVISVILLRASVEILCKGATAWRKHHDWLRTGRRWRRFRRLSLPPLPPARPRKARRRRERKRGPSTAPSERRRRLLPGRALRPPGTARADRRRGRRDAEAAAGEHRLQGIRAPRAATWSGGEGPEGRAAARGGRRAGRRRGPRNLRIEGRRHPSGTGASGPSERLRIAQPSAFVS